MSDDDLLPSWINGDRARETPSPAGSRAGGAADGLEDRDEARSVDADPQTDGWAPPADVPDRPVAGASADPFASAPEADVVPRPGSAGSAAVQDTRRSTDGRARDDDWPIIDTRVEPPGDEPAFEIDRSTESGWVAVGSDTHNASHTDEVSENHDDGHIGGDIGADPPGVAAGEGGQAWPDGPDVDASPVRTQEMTGLWLCAETGRESPLRIDGEPIDPRDAGIGTDLALRLLDYSDMWQRDWDPVTGWRPRSRPDDFEALGRHLARQLKDGVGATEVTLYLSHLGRAGVETVLSAPLRVPRRVLLMNDVGRSMPVWGEFVTASGVGSFSSELNLKLEAWAEVFAENMGETGAGAETGAWRRPHIAQAYRVQAEALAEEMRAELGPDYAVHVDLWELEGIDR